MTRNEIAQYACRNTKFYHEKYRELLKDCAWEDLPIIQKHEVVHAGVSIISAEYFSMIGDSRMIRIYTSGSTGESMELFTTNAEQAKALLSLWLYRRKYYNINMDAKFCYFFTVRDYLGETQFEYRGNGFGISKELIQEQNIPMIYEKICSFHPDWLLLQPSIAMMLARYIFESDAPLIPSLRYIELSGEMVSEHQMQFIRNAFEAPVANQYGCNEMGTIAYQCPMGHLHIMEHNAFVEIVPQSEEDERLGQGHIVVTAKNNKVMPLIRYDTGDIGRWKKGACTCQNSAPILELVGARKDDLIRLQNGDVVSANLFRRVFQSIECCIDGRIYQYQIVQRDYDDFEIYIATDEEKTIIEKLFYQFVSNSVIKDSKFTFQYDTYILPQKKVGKMKFFSCNIPEMMK